MGIKPTIKGLGSFRFGSVRSYTLSSVRFDTSSSVRFQQQGSSVRFGSTLPVRFSSSSNAVRFGSVRHSPKIGFEFGVFGSGSVRFRSPNLFTENYAEARISDYGMGTESTTEGLGSLPFA